MKKRLGEFIFQLGRGFNMSNTMYLNRFLKMASWTLLSVVALLSLVIGIALSSTGVKLAIDYVNDAGLGVEIDYQGGSFYSQVTLTKVRVVQPSMNAEVSDLTVDVGLRCLFAAELCINQIRLDKIDVQLVDAPKQDTPVKELENKLIQLPILITLSELSVGEVRVSQSNNELLTLKDLLLALSFQNKLIISRFDIQSLDVQLPKSGNELTVNEVSKTIEQDAPRPWLKALADYQYTPIIIPDIYIPIELAMKKAMLRNICVRQQAQDGSLATLFCHDTLALELAIKNQKLDLQLNIDNLNQNSAEPIFAPANVKFKANVHFAKNFEHTVTLNILKQDTPILSKQNALKKDALNKDTPILNNPLGFEFKSVGSVKQVNMTLTHLPTQQKLLTLSSSVQLNKATLPVGANMAFGQLVPAVITDIQASLPGLNADFIKPLIGVSLLRAEIRGDMLGYRLTSTLDTEDIMGVQHVDVNALFKPMGNKQAQRALIDIQNLQLSGSIGTLDYSGKVLLSPQTDGQNELSWAGLLGLDSLQLSTLDPAIDSFVSGKVPHSIMITETTQSAKIKGANLRGTWQTLPLSLIADAELEKSGNILVETMRLRQGDNQLHVQGKLYSTKALESIKRLGANFPKPDNADDASLDFTLDLQTLRDIYPDLQGQIYAKGKVSGAIELPKIIIQAQAKDINGKGISLEDALVDISVNVAKKLSSKAQISIVNLSAAGQYIPLLNVELSGDESEQALRLSLPQGEYITEQFFKGQLNADNSAWSGKWLEGSIVSDVAELSLQSQPSLNLNLQPFSFFLEQHCWEGRGDSLCASDINATQQQAKTKIALDYNLMNTGVAKLLPNVDIERSDLDVNVDVEVDWQAQQGLSFSADIGAQNATFVSNENKVSIENVIAKVQGTPRTIESSFSFDSTEAGTVRLNSYLDLASQPYQHQGDIVISEFAVSYFASFITAVKKLNGDINADIAFTGPIDKPSLLGELTLADGAVILKEYPLRLADYNQKVVFKGSKADFAGQFTLGDGKGSINGDIDFSEALIVNTIIVGDKLDIAYESYQFQVSPDLSLKLRPELLSVSGKVEVPYARVKIKSLPPSAKSPSQDIIVIDEQKAVKQVSLPLDVNVNILIDKAKKGEVKLDALDLKAELSGDLNVQVDTQNTRVNGIVQVLKGEYEAYSQVLQIRKGDITFSGQPDVPAFEIEAIRNPLNTRDNVIAGIRVAGNALKPTVELFSEPSMEQARQLSYLISGADSFGAGGGPSDSNTTLVNALLSYGVGRSENGIGSLGQKLGVKDLNLQTAGQGSDTQVQLSGQLADGVKITYGIGVFDSVSEVSVHYQLLPQLYLEAVSGVNSTLDLYYEITSNDD